MSRRLNYKALVLVALIVPRVAIAMPSFQGIGLVPGATAGSATDISGDGRVVVGTLVSLDPNEKIETYRWRGGAIENLGRLAGARNSFGGSVSSDGATLVGYSDLLDGRDVASMWRDGSWAQLEAAVGGVIPDRATGVSADGAEIVGRIGAGTASEPFRWTEGITTSLGLSGTSQNQVAPYASGISGDGSRIAIHRARSNRRDDGFALWENGTFTRIDGLNANAISADGRIVVGNSFVGPGLSEFEASIWSEADGIVPLGRVPGFGFAVARDASADGSVVIGSTRFVNPGGGATGPRSGFIWDAEVGMRRIDEYITMELMLDLSGWILNEVTAVSDDGMRFVGNGVSPSGVVQGWILVVPEPSTAILLALGLIILGVQSPPRQVRSLDAT